MKIRSYEPKDCAELAELFYNTVHAVNAKDYTKAQLEAWADGNIDMLILNKSLLEHNTLVAQEHSFLVGFGDMDDSGYLDRLYVHKNYQGRGIATMIVNKLEKSAALHGVLLFTVHASITAKPFFEKQGYLVVNENIVVKKGIKLSNFIMEKRIATVNQSLQ